ncbi:MAG: outer membrane beta-barrel protein [Pseudomonadota bacterium]
MIRSALLTGIAIFALGSAAFAADLPSTKAPPVYAPPPPALNWSGLYVGGNAGYGWTSGDGNEFCIDPTGVLNGSTCQVLPPGTSGVASAHGALVGGQLGYNWQSGAFVYGIETDLDAAFIRSSTFANGPFGFAGGGAPATPAGISTSNLDIRSIGTVRARLGYAFADRLLAYVTGGLAYGDVTANSLFTAPNVGTTYAGSSSSWRAGWTVGGGLEYAIDNNWSVKVEGLYYDLGSITTLGSEAPLVFAPTGYQHNVRFDVNGALVRAGINYKFDMFAPPTPVAAKY